jgi:hypothetical protein
MKVKHTILMIFSILLLVVALIFMIDYNKDSFIKAELQYECNLWAGAGQHTTNSITNKITIVVNNKTYHLKNNETTLNNNCIFK